MITFLSDCPKESTTLFWKQEKDSKNFVCNFVSTSILKLSLASAFKMVVRLLYAWWKKKVISKVLAHFLLYWCCYEVLLPVLGLYNTWIHLLCSKILFKLNRTWSCSVNKKKKEETFKTTFGNETLQGLNITVEIDIIEIFECYTDMRRNERFFSASALKKINKLLTKSQKRGVRKEVA